MDCADDTPGRASPSRAESLAAHAEASISEDAILASVRERAVDIGAGAVTLRQTVFRPTVRWNPYRTPIEGVYLCSSSTPPGGGVHGMCGYHAALAALQTLGQP